MGGKLCSGTVVNFCRNKQGIGNVIEYATSLKGLFYLRPDIDLCIVNIALWFLIALFIVQLIHFFCCRFIKNRAIIFFIGISLFITSTYLNEEKITGAFYLTNICSLYIFYIIGSFWGNDLINILEKKPKKAKGILISCCFFVIIAMSFVHTGNLLLSQTLLFIRTICFFPIIFATCKAINHLAIVAPLKYFGVHSLEILVTHMPLLNLINIAIFKIILDLPFEKLFANTGLYMFILFFACLVLEYFLIIRFCNKYLYPLLGKSRETLAGVK